MNGFRKSGWSKGLADEWVWMFVCDQDTVALSAVEFFEPAEMDRLLCGEQKPWYTPQPQPAFLTSRPESAFFTSVKSWNSSSCELSACKTVV